MFTLFIQKTNTTVVHVKHIVKLCTDKIHIGWCNFFKFIITLFLNAGVPINAVDIKENAALDYAIQHDFDSTRCEFLKHIMLFEA